MFKKKAGSWHHQIDRYRRRRGIKGSCPRLGAEVGSLQGGKHQLITARFTCVCSSPCSPKRGGGRACSECIDENASSDPNNAEMEQYGRFLQARLSFAYHCNDDDDTSWYDSHPALSLLYTPGRFARRVFIGHPAWPNKRCTIIHRRDCTTIPGRGFDLNARASNEKKRCATRTRCTMQW